VKGTAALMHLAGSFGLKKQSGNQVASGFEQAEYLG
jgi:hypothetical protein